MDCNWLIPLSEPRVNTFLEIQITRWGFWSLHSVAAARITHSTRVYMSFLIECKWLQHPEQVRPPNLRHVSVFLLRFESVAKCYLLFIQSTNGRSRHVSILRLRYSTCIPLCEIPTVCNLHRLRITQSHKIRNMGVVSLLDLKI